MVPYVQVTIELPAALYEQACYDLARRGTTLDEYVRLKLKGMTARKWFYGLKDTFTFGKYRGETVENVIRGDPEYCIWALKTVDGFDLHPEALELLTDMGVDYG